ncbi:uncharacterized protein BKCO1_2400085 [Diplodia corticola]|uniref:Secreted protein n=1 Tax=Diplodia corticola TaxID=236234 RepID=A0A1J9QZ23_9PEZI|nr:uncharacterized protein BKCO1_2400085 [Diplodia corticola]OJD34326.1 hypothetical protein BKCO1_2400085 [Diplodia corticola]
MRLNTASMAAFILTFVFAFLLHGVAAYPDLTALTSPQCPTSPPDPRECDREGLGDTGRGSHKWVGNGFTLQYKEDLYQDCYAMHNFRGEAGKCYNVEGTWLTCRPALWYSFDGSADCTVWEARDCDSNGGSSTKLVNTQQRNQGFGADGKQSMRVLSHKCVAN